MTVAEATIAIPPEHPCLAGHFPGHPLVPAVVLIDLAADAARQALGLGPLIAIGRGKFLAPVRPGEVVTLAFTPRDGARVAIAGRIGDAPCFTIEAAFAPGDAV